MNVWHKHSERYLLYHITTSDSENSQLAYAELVNRLRRYLSKTVTLRGWYDLKRHEEDIIAETIARLSEKHDHFVGNSWQFRKYTRRVLASVCSYVYGMEIKENLFPIEFFNSDTLESSLFKFTISNRVSVGWQDRFDYVSALSLEQNYARQEQDAIINDAQRTLTDECRKLLYHDKELEQPQKEIAKLLGLTHSNVRVKLHRCRMKLLRHALERMANQQARFQDRTISLVIEKLEPPYKALLQKWWRGETSWKQLGQSLTPIRNTKETQVLFAEGLLRLMAMF